MKRNIKFLSVLMAAALLIASFALVMPVVAESPATNWKDHAATSFAGGDGSKADPYQISNAAELAYLAVYTNANAAKNEYFKITATEIDLGEHQWTPIGHTGHEFRSIFDGNGATIKNLRLENQTYNNGYCGMFGRITSGSTIKNLSLTAIVSINNNCQYVGAIAGSMYGNARVTNCNVTVTMKLTPLNHTQRTKYGGAIGYMTNDGYVNGVNVYGTIEVAASGNPITVGGIIGRVTPTTGRDAKIQNSANYATVYIEHDGADSIVTLGGIVGMSRQDGQTNGTTGILNCVNYGSLSFKAHEGRVGGIMGDAGMDGKNVGYLTCENCINVGSITGEGTTVQAGSIVGFTEQQGLTLNNCFSSATYPLYNGTNSGEGSYAEAKNSLAGISLETLTGARVRIDTTAEASSGIRFDSCISKELYDALSAMGDNVGVILGTMIAPSGNIKAVKDSYDKMGALRAAGNNTYVGVPVKDASWVNEQCKDEAGYNENAYYFAGAVGKIYERNYLTEYSAVAYLTLMLHGEEAGDWSFTFYANDGIGADGNISADRVRSVGYVGHCAYQDGSAHNGVYTDAQMAILKKYSDAYTTAD